MNKALIEKYSFEIDKVPVSVEIVREPKEFVLMYNMLYPKIEETTKAIIESVRTELISEVPVSIQEVLDPKYGEVIKERFRAKAEEFAKTYLPHLDAATREVILGTLVQEMLGMGVLELVIADPNLEEIVINSASEPVWVYHKKYGWLKTNVHVKSESQCLEYAKTIGRRVGRQITVLNPLMDAHLLTGDRVNATMFPISTDGNTLTIRKFARKPWTIASLLREKTLDLHTAAFLWQAIQYEMNLVIGGGTASGKTTFMNALMPFIPPNQRVISIEDTRELNLPKYLHWVPLTTRAPNPEGKGGVGMLDLMVNSLRMRPDRVVFGEIRRSEEAEVLFEAMNTGHSVYSTIHANTADHVRRRLINPPISIAEPMLESLHLTVVQFRDRRKGLRRTYELAEILPATGSSGNIEMKMNVLYRWKAANDEIVKQNDSLRVIDEIAMHTGMMRRELEDDLEERAEVLDWMVRSGIDSVDGVGKVTSTFCVDKETVLAGARKNKKPAEVVGAFE